MDPKALNRPSIGRIVQYTLSADDAEKINRRRTNGGAIAQRLTTREWPVGAQAHIGANVTEGDVLPMLIVRVTIAKETESDGEVERVRVNGQVFLDGTDIYWTVQVSEGTGPGTWAWPTRQ